MKKDNKVCICCGTTYKYCSGCAEYAALPQWKNIYDKIECKVIFDVATDYNAKHITKEEAKKLLGKYDIKNINMKESLAKIINEILNNTTFAVEKTAEKNEVEVEAEELVEKHITEESVDQNSFVKNNKKK